MSNLGKISLVLVWIYVVNVSYSTANVILSRSARRPCKTPVIDITGEAGVKTERHGSVIEFPLLTPTIKQGDYISLDFKTEKDQGLLLFLADQSLHNYIAVYLHRDSHQAKKVIFKFRCGNTNGKLHTGKSYRDGQFHKLTLSRTEHHEVVTIDSENPFVNYFMNCPDLTLAYLGGLPTSLQVDLRFNDIRHKFQGCLKNFELNSSPIEASPKYYGVSVC